MQVTYNGYTLPHVVETMFIEKTYTQATFRCVFVIQESSASSLVSECEDAEEALREPFETLTTSFGGSSEYSFSHDNNTGMNSQPSLRILPERQTETTRTYEFSLTVMLPADKAGFDFRRNSTMDISEGASSIKTVTFSLEYTAGGNNGSFENFLTFAEAFCLARLSSFLSGKVFELVDQNSKTDDQDKLTTGTFIFRERADRDSEATFNDAQIKEMNINYQLDTPSLVGILTSFGEESVISARLNISFFCHIDKDITTVAQLNTIYRDKISPLLVSNAKTVMGLDNKTDFDTGSMYIENESIRIDSYSFVISGTLTIVSPNGNSSIIYAQEERALNFNSGLGYTKLHDGKENTFSVWGYGSKTIVIRSIVVIKLNEPPFEDVPVLDGDFILLESNVQRSQTGVGFGNFSPTKRHVLHKAVINEKYLLVDKSGQRAEIQTPSPGTPSTTNSQANIKNVSQRAVRDAFFGDLFARQARLALFGPNAPQGDFFKVEGE